MYGRMPSYPDVVVAAGIGADVDDQRARARNLHAFECGARELVELRFVAPVELVDRQQRCVVGEQLEAKQLFEGLLAERGRRVTARFGHRFGAADAQPETAMLAEELPVPEGEPIGQQLGAQRRRIAVHVREQLFGNVVGRHTLDRVDALAGQRRRRAVDPGAHEDCAALGDMHGVRKQTPTALEMALDLGSCAPGEQDGQVAVGHHRIQAAHDLPGFVCGHRTIQLRAHIVEGPSQHRRIHRVRHVRMCTLQRRFDGRQVRPQLLGRECGRLLGLRGDGPGQQPQARTYYTAVRRTQHRHALLGSQTQHYGCDTAADAPIVEAAASHQQAGSRRGAYG